jgi:hypothetical protein
MVNVVADGAFGIGDAVVVTEQFSHARSVKASPKSSTPKILVKLRR